MIVMNLFMNNNFFSTGIAGNFLHIRADKVKLHPVYVLIY